MNFMRATVLNVLLLGLLALSSAVKIKPASVPTAARLSPSHGVLDISEPIEVMLPDNSLIAAPAAQKMVEGIREQVVAKGSCNPNVCFAIDGGSFVSEDDFRRQLEFVQLIAAIVGADVRSAFAAVQYTRPLSPISFLTTDTNQFLLDVEDTLQEGGFRSGVRGGFRFCARQLRGNLEDVNKIVILADGRSFFPRNAGRISRRFRRRSIGNAVCAVGIGFGNDTDFLENITGTPSRVLTIDQYFELLDIIDQLVAEICGL